MNSISYKTRSNSNISYHNVELKAKQSFFLLAIALNASNAKALPATYELSSLNGANGFQVNGINSQDFSGRSVSTAGDFNGDGLQDIIIGASSADAIGRTNAGQTYVIYGRAASYTSQLNLSQLNGTNGFIINGISENHRSGNTVSNAGDINGDGFDDILIGGIEIGPNGNPNDGECYVIFGTSEIISSPLELSSLNNNIGFIVKGNLDTFFGNSLSGAGDINNDGIADFIVGAPGVNNSRGEAYIIFGKTDTFDAIFEASNLNGSNGFTISGSDNELLFGRSVSDGEDINSDGIDDIIISSWGTSTSGSIYIVYGSSSSPANIPASSLDGNSGFMINSLDNSDGNAGISVSGIGDVNGDSLNDIAIGANETNPNNISNAGQAYIVLGNSTGFPAIFELSALDGNNGFILNGNDFFGYAGFSVSGPGDFNNDGINDVLVSGHGATPDNGVDRAGESYLIFGKTTPFPMTMELSNLDETAGITFNGVDQVDYSGISISGAGDINGDEINDLAIGAFRADPNNTLDSGETYVIFGTDVLFADGYEP